MGQINDQGIWTYADNDIVQSWPVFMNLGFNSVSDVVKGLQKGRVIIANNAQDYDTKLSAIRKAGGGQFDVLIYRKDTREFLINTNGQLVKVAGGAVETGFSNSNTAFGTWKRYNTDNNAVIQTNITLPKAGLWLLSAHITITNDYNAQNSNIDVFVQVDGGGFNNVGTINTYTYNSNVMSFRASPISKYIDRPNQSVNYAVKIAVNPSSNIGWGGLTVQATKIG